MFNDSDDERDFEESTLDDDFDFVLPDIEEDVLPSGRGRQQKIELIDGETYDNDKNKKKPWTPSRSRPVPKRGKVKPKTATIKLPEFAPKTKDYDYNNADFHTDKPVNTPYYKEAQEDETALDSLEENLEDTIMDIYQKDESAIDELSNDEYTPDELYAMKKRERNGGEEQVEAFEDSVFSQIEEDDDEDDVASILQMIHNPDFGDDYEDDDSQANFRVTDEEETLLRNFNIDEIIAYAIDVGASDIHITPDEKVSYTVNGDILWSDSFPEVPGEITRILQQSMVSNVADTHFIENWELDTSYVVKTGAYEGRRVRLNVSRKDDFTFMTMRVISDRIPQPEELGIEKTLLEWSMLPNGLIMMNGPTGTGKALGLSTGLRSLNGEIITMKNVKIGDYLIGSNNKPCKVIGLSPIDYSPKLYKITFSNGEEIISDSNHQWIVSTRLSRQLIAMSDFDGLREYNTKHLLLSEIVESLSVNDLTNKSWSELSDLLSYSTKLNFKDEYIGLLLRFLDLDKDSEKSIFIRLLSQRIKDNLEYGLESQYMVLTLTEMFTLGLNNHFAVPSISSNKEINIHNDYYLENQLEIISIEEIAQDSELYEPVRCISVDSVDSSYVSESGIITHNSTTLASMIQNVQNERACKIITLEKPIEYIYNQNGKALVHQREIGRDSLSFSAALDSAMRSAPDVILIGETRNHTEVDALLYAAETGHLAISTMHSISAPDTITRIKSLFSGSDQQRVLSSLSTATRGFANQVLLKTADGKGRFAVREILEVDYEISRMIEAGDTRSIRELQEARGITLEHNLVKAIIDGKCTIEEAKSKTAHPLLFNKLLDDYYS